MNWSTATELNNKGFEVQRRASLNPSEGGTLEWEIAGFVEGSGTTTEKHEYSFTEEALTEKSFTD